MVHNCSIHLSRDFGFHHSHGCSGYHTRMMGKGRLHFANIKLSSHAFQQDAWSVHVLNSLHGPISPSSSRCNVFVCRSVLVPGEGNEMPILKTAAVILTRSYDALRGTPHVLQLIPAVGIVVFAVWGLGPIMRLCRIIFLRKTDRSWNQSRTQYAMNSYLRPLLLLAGAQLIFRALDPLAASHAAKQRLLNFVWSLSTVLTFAHCLSCLIQQAQNINDSSDARNRFTFAQKAIWTAAWIAAVSLFVELLGFSTQKCLTAGGLGTVLLTLAGREIFENFLSGVMIHATRPFVVNEWIQTNIGGYEVSGIVEHVGWWLPTVIRGDDREAVYIPNHKFNVSVVRNLSQKSHWRIKTHLAISHLDNHKIKIIVADMRKVLAKNPQVEQQRLHRRVFLEYINPENQALMILISCFVKTSRIEEYLCVKEAVLLDLLRVVSHHRARLATPIRTVQKIYSEADLENVPFAETIFSRSRSPANRPPLLIEPSYKINGDDKSKASTRAVPANEEKDAMDEATPTSDSKADAKVATTSASDSNADAKVGSASVMDSKMDDKVTAPSASNSGTKPETQKQPNKESVGDALKETVGLNAEAATPSGIMSKKPPFTPLESGSEKPEMQRVISQATEDYEKQVKSPSIARPPLEENIVLGVALEGSKRTLPIDDDEMSPSPVSAESKELASRRNGSGSPVGKDKKDGTMSAVPSGTD